MTLEDWQEHDIPNTPGVYFFMKDNIPLYIGKATNLKQRSLSYFSHQLMETRGPIILKMVEEADRIEYQETASVLEALLLESYLIKTKQPVYNTKEKDNKSFNYVVISDEVIPRVYILRQRQLQARQGKGESFLHVFGPFPQGQLLREALGIIRKIFPFYTKHTNNAHAKEFYHQLGLLPGTNQEAYAHTIEYLALFFKGQKASVIRGLKKDMMRYAKALQFEQADRIKKQIHALEHIHDLALLKHDFELASYKEGFRMEAYDIAHLQGDAMVGVMVVHNGFEITPQEHRVFNIQGFTQAHDIGALKEVLRRRLAHPEWAYPDIIIVDGAIAQKRAMESVLREFKQKIPVLAVVKDERHKAKAILGQKKLSEKYHKQVLALNAESHRFALKHHTQRRGKTFLG